MKQRADVADSSGEAGAYTANAVANDEDRREIEIRQSRRCAINSFHMDFFLNLDFVFRCDVLFRM